MKALAAILCALAFALIASAAGAGTITISDATGFVSGADGDQLRADHAKWPFDAHVTVDDAPNLETLESEAHAAVDGPNVIVIAIAPQLHKVVVRFGTATGVKTGDYDSISQAGNAHFRAHEVADGFEAILLRARASREAHTAISTSSTPVVIEQGLSGWTWLGIATLFAAVVGIIVWQVRRARREREEYQKHLDDNAAETAELRSRNIDEMTWAEKLKDDPKASSPDMQRGKRPPAPEPFVDDGKVRTAPYRTPLADARRKASAAPPSATRTRAAASQTTVNVQQSGGQGGGGSDLLTGMLIGESLSRPAPVIVEREVVRERDREPEPNRSDDAGGGSSGWGSDSGGSSSFDDSSSSDSGGSSSDYDSGGSSDFGGGDSGGGFDSGGGSSDF